MQPLQPVNAPRRLPGVAEIRVCRFAASHPFLRIDLAADGIIEPEDERGQPPVVPVIQLKLFSNFYLPLFVGKIAGEYMTVYEKGYTKEELEQTASETNRQFVEKLREKGVQILENNDKIEKNISGYRISGTLKVIEPAAVSVPVSKTQGD